MNKCFVKGFGLTPLAHHPGGVKQQEGCRGESDDLVVANDNLAAALKARFEAGK